MRMRPIFIVMVLASLGLMGYTFALGWRFHYGQADIDRRIERGEAVDAAHDEAVGSLLPRHFVFGLITGFAISFLHSVVLVYFLGTGKAIKEQMELQNWDSTDHDHSRKLMAKALVPSAVGLLLVIIIAISGGFALIQMIPPDVHMVISVIGIIVQFPVFFRQYTIIGENRLLMDKIVARLGGENIRIAL